MFPLGRGAWAGGRMKQPSTFWRAVMTSGIRSVHKSGDKPPLVKWWQPIRAIQMCPFGAIESCLEKIKACYKGCKWELSAHDDSSPTPLSAALHEATGSTGKQIPCSKKSKSWWLVLPISDKSPKGRTVCGMSTHLQRTIAGVRLVRAVKADKRDHNSCLVAAGRLQRAVIVSFITAGFTNPISTAVSINKRNTKHWYKHGLVLVWSGCGYADSIQIVWHQPETAS